MSAESRRQRHAAAEQQISTSGKFAKAGEESQVLASKAQEMDYFLTEIHEVNEHIKKFLDTLESSMNQNLTSYVMDFKVLWKSILKNIHEVVQNWSRPVVVFHTLSAVAGIGSEKGRWIANYGYIEIGKDESVWRTMNILSYHLVQGRNISEARAACADGNYTPPPGWDWLRLHETDAAQEIYNFTAQQHARLAKTPPPRWKGVPREILSAFSYEVLPIVAVDLLWDTMAMMLGDEYMFTRTHVAQPFSLDNMSRKVVSILAEHDKTIIASYDDQRGRVEEVEQRRLATETNMSLSKYRGHSMAAHSIACIVVEAAFEYYRTGVKDSRIAVQASLRSLLRISVNAAMWWLLKNLPASIGTWPVLFALDVVCALAHVLQQRQRKQTMPSILFEHWVLRTDVSLETALSLCNMRIKKLEGAAATQGNDIARQKTQIDFVLSNWKCGEGLSACAIEAKEKFGIAIETNEKRWWLPLVGGIPVVGTFLKATLETPSTTVLPSTTWDDARFRELLLISVVRHVDNEARRKLYKKHRGYRHWIIQAVQVCAETLVKRWLFGLADSWTSSWLGTDMNSRFQNVIGNGISRTARTLVYGMVTSAATGVARALGLEVYTGAAGSSMTYLQVHRRKLYEKTADALGGFQVKSRAGEDDDDGTIFVIHNDGNTLRLPLATACLRDMMLPQQPTKCTITRDMALVDIGGEEWRRSAGNVLLRDIGTLKPGDVLFVNCMNFMRPPMQRGDSTVLGDVQAYATPVYFATARGATLQSQLSRAG